MGGGRSCLKTPNDAKIHVCVFITSLLLSWKRVTPAVPYEAGGTTHAKIHVCVFITSLFLSLKRVNPVPGGIPS